jgi:hypothetical protein
MTNSFGIEQQFSGGKSSEERVRMASEAMIRTLSLDGHHGSFGKKPTHGSISSTANPSLNGLYYGLYAILSVVPYNKGNGYSPVKSRICFRPQYSPYYQQVRSNS